MAFDGITVAAMVAELKNTIKDGRVNKIAQPEKDALLLTIKAAGGQYRLFMSANASLPLIYLDDENRQSPQTAPAFCMLMRKYVQNAKIVDITQPGLERVIRISLSGYNEMGDERVLSLVCEIMGKHSNIILLDENDRVIDSIKRVSAMVSSVREVLPGKDYFIPDSGRKADPLSADEGNFLAAYVSGKTNDSVENALSAAYQGISRQAAGEILLRAGVDGRTDVAGLYKDTESFNKLKASFFEICGMIKAGRFSPCICFENGKAAEYAAYDTAAYADKEFKESISEVLKAYYGLKERDVRTKQRTADLRKIVQTATERCVKKLQIHDSQLKDGDKKDKYRLYGELLSAYAYQIPEGVSEYVADDYNSGEKVKISLDPELSAQANAKKYYDRYAKLKRTFEAALKLKEEGERELEYLTNTAHFLDMVSDENDLRAIREELHEAGYIKKSGEKKNAFRSRPLHYVTEDGFHIYVGKNNHQNDELTFKKADGADWWFHAKKMPGSHVIVKTEGRELPDRVYEQAAALAAYYSKAAEQEKAEVDYVLKKNIKKPNGAAPGFVVYYTNYSMAIKPGIEGLKQLKD
ncbi:MAG: NFACT family protein [Lachnospiraceae bacterium]|nr:NFACT family protein [Lachnospiraceae bacterium]